MIGQAGRGEAYPNKTITERGQDGTMRTKLVLFDRKGSDRG